MGEADGHYDAPAATRCAYNCSRPEVARIMSYRLLSSISILEVLNIYFNVGPTEEYLKILDRAIHNKNLTLAQVEALKLKAEYLGLRNASSLPGRRRATGRVPAILPPDVEDAIKEARKSSRKKPERKKPATETAPPPSEYGF